MDSTTAILKDVLALVSKLDAKTQEAAQREVVLTGLFATFARAVITSHPDPSSFREEWNQQVSVFWTGVGLTELRQKEFGQHVQSEIESAFQGR